MSIFSRLKNSKKAAKEHKAKASQQIAVEEIPKTPYKHVPTHAAVDALSGAPSSWKHEDRPKIIEHHKRRSMMSIGRAGSSLSTRTWTESNASSSTPAIPSLLRNPSYNAYEPTWNDRGDHSYLNEPYQKRNRISRHQSFRDSGLGPSPLASKATSKHSGSPSGSSNSSLTNENLEMPQNPRPQVNTLSQQDMCESLQKKTKRKLGEAPVDYPRPSSAPMLSIAQVVTPTEKVAKEQKRRWMLKGKGRAIAAV